MNSWFFILTLVFIVVSAAMVLIILVQRPSGGGLAGAFGGAGGSGTDTVFGGRVGDALTYITIAGFVLYLGLSISLSLVESDPGAAAATGAATIGATDTPVEGDPVGTLGGGADMESVGDPFTDAGDGDPTDADPLPTDGALIPE